MRMLQKFIQGNYINFAICEYYEDQSFTSVSLMVLQCILNQDQKLIGSHSKINRQQYTLVEEFFKKHLEVIFLRFDFAIILSMVEKILMPGMRQDAFEIKSSALLTVDALNEFVFNNLRKPSKKQP
jgi:hypothetical protein